ncbi:MAG: 16S rRNA (adenine(1518)-N(6)/adenine(1519)-N(6))-dimethyltransferase RsmA [Candidatus Eisenbacteria bacterium]
MRARKKLGQNFLTDANVANKLVRLLAPQKDEVVLEIGAGLGAVTLPLAATGAKVFAVEVDSGLCAYLARFLRDARFPGDSSRAGLSGGPRRVELLHADVLELSLPELLRKAKVDQVQVLGNLPYSITTQILLFLMENRKHVGRALITVQREYAERLVAKPGSRLYGSISVMTQFHWTVRKVGGISPKSFFPRPEVSSSVLEVRPRAKPTPAVRNEETFEKVVRGAFAQRRKTLLNSLAASLGLDKQAASRILREAGVTEARRAESLTLEDFARIADVFYGIREV